MLWDNGPAIKMSMAVAAVPLLGPPVLAGSRLEHDD